MSDALPPPDQLRPVPGTARGRRSDDRRLARPRRRPRPGDAPASSGGRSGARPRGCATAAGSLAVILLSVTFSLHGRHAHRSRRCRRRRRPGVLGRRPLWLNGGDPYHPTGPFLPYVYAPWMLPAVRAVGGPALGRRLVRVARRDDPAAALDDPLGVPPAPADDRGHRRPRSAFPFGANLDTGNINLQLTLMLWAAQFSGPRLGGLLWALATWMKWIPVIVWPILSVGAKRWGLLWLAVVDRPQPGPAADDHPPVPGAVRVRDAGRCGSTTSSSCGRSCRGGIAGRTPCDVFRPATWLAWLRPSPELQAVIRGERLGGVRRPCRADLELDGQRSVPDPRGGARRPGRAGARRRRRRGPEQERHSAARGRSSPRRRRP